MSGPNWTDLALLVPELILVGAALALILAARRVQRAPWVFLAPLAAAIAAGGASVWLSPGSPETGFGGLVVVDGYSQFFKGTIACALALATLLSEHRMDADRVRPAEYYALMLLAATGMMLSASAFDLVTLYLSLELTTLCSYILVGIVVDRPQSNEAALKFFLLGSFASALLLYGIALA
jgi:NADH-quinone oxidoreductase subunit N